jgi:hypothetical protein
MTKFSSIKAKLSSEQLSTFETMENSSEILGTVVSKKSVGGCWEVQFEVNVAQRSVQHFYYQDCNNRFSQARVWEAHSSSPS